MKAFKDCIFPVGAFATDYEFYERILVGTYMFISFIKSIRSNLLYLDSFQVLVLTPHQTEITFLI